METYPDMVGIHKYYGVQINEARRGEALQQTAANTMWRNFLASQLWSLFLDTWLRLRITSRKHMLSSFGVLVAAVELWGSEL